MHLRSLVISLSCLLPLVLGFHVARQSSSNSSTLTGGSVCASLMCITATVNGSDVEYDLQSKGSASLGWMAIGFGTLMANSPMVIMWPNTDGTVTLSQRSASGQVMPTVQANPPRIASVQESSIDLTSSTPKLAFTIPKNSDTVQDLIWAFGSVSPASSAVDATLVQHRDSGSVTIDLTGSLSSTVTPSTSSTPTSSSGGTSSPLLGYQRLVIAHAVLCLIGFMALLPLGTLVARYLRSVTPIWFKSHWIIQVFIAGPVVVVGFALGVQSVSTSGSGHLNDDHKKWGLTIFILYLLQCTLGFVIHKFKPSSSINRRPIQNYLHPIIGLLTISLALRQVRTGYKFEWPNMTGKPTLPKAIDIVWTLWVVLLPVLYFIGLSFLPRQLRQERDNRKRAIPMNKLNGRNDDPKFMTHGTEHSRYTGASFGRY